MGRQLHRAEWQSGSGGSFALTRPPPAEAVPPPPRRPSALPRRASARLVFSVEWVVWCSLPARRATPTILTTPLPTLSWCAFALAFASAKAT